MASGIHGSGRNCMTDWGSNYLVNQVTVVAPSILVGGIGLAIILGITNYYVVARQGPFSSLYRLQVINRNMFAAGLGIGAMGGFVFGEVGAVLCSFASKPVTYECCVVGAFCLEGIAATKR